MMGRARYLTKLDMYTLVRLGNWSTLGPFSKVMFNDRGAEKGVLHTPPVYLHLIFEISSVTRFFFNFEISSLKN